MAKSPAQLSLAAIEKARTRAVKTLRKLEDRAEAAAEKVADARHVLEQIDKQYQLVKKSLDAAGEAVGLKPPEEA